MTNSEQAVSEPAATSAVQSDWYVAVRLGQHALNVAHPLVLVPVPVPVPVPVVTHNTLSSAVQVVALPSDTTSWQPACSSEGSVAQQLLSPEQPVPPVPVPVPVPGHNTLSSAVHVVAMPSDATSWQPACSVEGSVAQQLLSPAQPVAPVPVPVDAHVAKVVR